MYFLPLTHADLRGQSPKEGTTVYMPRGASKQGSPQPTPLGISSNEKISPKFAPAAPITANSNTLFKVFSKVKKKQVKKERMEKHQSSEPLFSNYNLRMFN